MEDVIHHRLKGTRRICQPEEHNQRFEQSVFRFKRSLFFIAGLNPDVVIAPSHVEFGEDVGILYLTDKVWYEQQWVAIADCVFVQFLIVLYRT